MALLNCLSANCNRFVTDAALLSSCLCHSSSNRFFSPAFPSRFRPAGPCVRVYATFFLCGKEFLDRLYFLCAHTARQFRNGRNRVEESRVEGADPGEIKWRIYTMRPRYATLTFGCKLLRCKSWPVIWPRSGGERARKVE